MISTCTTPIALLQKVRMDNQPFVYQSKTFDPSSPRFSWSALFPVYEDRLAAMAAYISGARNAEDRNTDR